MESSMSMEEVIEASIVAEKSSSLKAGRVYEIITQVERDKRVREAEEEREREEGKTGWKGF